MEICIDAKNLVLGRLSSYAAKKAILGNDVKIFNSEDAVITGNKEFILKRYKERRARGNTVNGPFFPKIPERFIKRTIRGMLPYKKPRGVDAMKKILCYSGIPEEFKDKKLITLPSADVAKTQSMKFLRVKDICKNMGGKI